MKVWMRGLAAIGMMALVSGCAASRSVVEVQPAAVDNPVQGAAVKIVKVNDGRTFDPAPPNPETPSLAGEDVHNPTITARAIGRKRNGYGMAMGDVVLPEGRTVSQVVAQALTNGFRQAGYRVLPAGSPGYDEAIPVDADVKRFWSWLSPGFASVGVHNRAEVRLTGGLPALGNGLTVQGGADTSGAAVFDSDWQETAAKGLDDLSANLARALKTNVQAAK